MWFSPAKADASLRNRIREGVSREFHAKTANLQKPRFVPISTTKRVFFDASHFQALYATLFGRAAIIHEHALLERHRSSSKPVR